MKAICTVACMLAAASLGAQQKTDSSVFLPEVIVSSPFQSSVTSPLTISRVSRQEIERKHHGQEPSLILAQTPSVSFYSDAGSGNGYSYFRIRGIDQTRINMSLNGVPLNEPEDQGVYFSNYPDLLSSVSSIQIQRGMGYSKNGVAAYGGSLYIESLPFRDSAARELSAGYGSFNTYRAHGAFNSGIKNNTGIYASASHLHSDGYKDHSANTSGSAFVNAGYWGDRHKIYAVSFLGYQKNQLAWIGAPMDSIVKNSAFNANSKNESDAFQQAHLQLHHEWQLNTKHQLHSGIFYNYLNGNYDFDLNNFLGMPANSELYNYAFRSHFTGLFSYHSYSTKHVKWYSGMQAQLYQRRHTGSERSVGKLYTNTGYRNEGNLFTKAIFTVNKWNLLADVQYRHSSFTYKGNETMPGQYWNFLNHTVGISYEVNSNFHLYYSFGQISREPTRNDLFMGSDDLTKDNNGNLLFNPLKPERGSDHEWGIKRFFKKGFVHANMYYMRFRNEITLNGQIGPTGVPLHSSVASSFRSGIELDGLYRFSGGLQIKNQSSFSFNRIREEDIKLQPVLTPSFISNQEVRLIRPLWQAGIGLRYQSRSYIDYANTATLPSHFIVNCDASWQVRSLAFFAVVNNITNRRYYTNGLITASGQPGYFVQAPFNFYIGAKLNW
ncbi:MAG: TonB-dependent receptor [Chitinophagaceae bacterium]